MSRENVIRLIKSLSDALQQSEETFKFPLDFETNFTNTYLSLNKTNKVLF